MPLAHMTQGKGKGPLLYPNNLQFPFGNSLSCQCPPNRQLSSSHLNMLFHSLLIADISPQHHHHHHLFSGSRSTTNPPLSPFHPFITSPPFTTSLLEPTAIMCGEQPLLRLPHCQSLPFPLLTVRNRYIRLP